MKLLTEIQCKDWLNAAKITEDPQGHPRPDLYPRQFQLPQMATVKLSMLRAIINVVERRGEALVVVIDWPLYSQDELAVIQGLRRHGGEEALIDAPGHLFDLAKEGDLAFGFFGLTTLFEWSAYLYFSSTGETFLNREGEFLDVWSKCPDLEIGSDHHPNRTLRENGVRASRL